MVIDTLVKRIIVKRDIFFLHLLRQQLNTIVLGMIVQESSYLAKSFFDLQQIYEVSKQREYKNHHLQKKVWSARIKRKILTQQRI